MVPKRWPAKLTKAISSPCSCTASLLALMTPDVRCTQAHSPSLLPYFPPHPGLGEPHAAFLDSIKPEKSTWHFWKQKFLENLCSHDPRDKKEWLLFPSSPCQGQINRSVNGRDSRHLGMTIKVRPDDQQSSHLTLVLLNTWTKTAASPLTFYEVRIKPVTHLWSRCEFPFCSNYPGIRDS